MITSNIFKFRWIYAACYEIVLPGGKVIVTDPFVTPDHLPGFTADDFTGADYIICSHTHYDHTSDIGYLAKKFQSKVICNENSIPYLARFFDLNYAHLYPVASNEILEFEDFKLQVNRAKHTKHPLNRDTYELAAMTSVNRYGITGHEDCDRFGWLQLLDYIFTFNDNTRLFLVAGIPVLDNIYSLADELRPNIVIRQTEGETPERYAELIHRFHAPFVFPNHHEATEQKYGMTMEQFTDQTVQALKKLNSNTKFVNPVPYQWYQLNMDIEML